MKLNKNAFALALGIVWGMIVFLVTNMILLRGGTGEHLSRLSQIYVGYTVSLLGSIIGLLWGFVTMFIAGWIVAWLYNRFSEPSTTAPKT
ncbi:MAG: bacteriophage holin [Ignavibacteria bacterium]|nr:bacteriophage holin [Ignavibacteria bacterium]